ncbi:MULTISPECIES: hypothetical protein [unclassified Crossiella]|uniref:hypothetical protein n=1 Tax=unclassified Crossiella TaxID=2620835 RepID=UPI00200014D7|nr:MULTISPECIES: hypothetical protein [unclassified Crossiella]MCK2242333.1 hypothetical protein [Crossiella sp. S99.2]MCK2254636.1 hypothetical protein [Crossiella sp. S99.1]
MITNSIRRCVLDCPAARPAVADLGWLVCGPCANQLAAALHDVVELWGLLPEVLESGSLPTDTPRGSPGPTAGTPARLAVIALRDPRTTRVDDGDPHSVVAVLSAWAQAVRADRGLFARRGPATVPGEARVLSYNLGWLISRSWITDFATELREIHTQLRAACGDFDRTIPVGHCPTRVLGDDGEPVACGVHLRAGLSADVIRCRGCGTAWPFTQWPELAYAQTPRAARPLRRAA